MQHANLYFQHNELRREYVYLNGYAALLRFEIESIQGLTTCRRNFYHANLFDFRERR